MLTRSLSKPTVASIARAAPVTFGSVVCFNGTLDKLVSERASPRKHYARHIGPTHTDTRAQLKYTCSEGCITFKLTRSQPTTGRPHTFACVSSCASRKWIPTKLFPFFRSCVLCPDRNGTKSVKVGTESYACTLVESLVLLLLLLLLTVQLVL